MNKKIIIVGSGTAGLIAALILKSRFKNIEIDIISSKKIDIVGVGEGSTEHWLSFCKHVNIPFEEFIINSDATIKYALKFINWKKDNFVHHIDADLDNYFGYYNSSYAYIISNNIKNKDYTLTNIWKDKLDLSSLPNQLNFNAFKLNDFLKSVCLKFNINFIEDEIKEVKTNSDGIDYLIGKINYKYDFYIDCSGFKKLLISKLNTKWVSFSKYLPLNEAIVFPTEDTDDYSVCINSVRMKCGWLFQTPTIGRWGNGYIYDNTFINADKAQQEVETLYNKEIKIFKNIKFDPGYLENPWVKNCLAIGLSSGFIEPLEASSIGTIINQTFLFMHKWVNYTEREIKDYNEEFTKININIRDFIILHYQIKEKDSLFWEKIYHLPIPYELKDNLNKWKNKLPTQLDFNSRNLIFNHKNFISIMHSLELFNVEKIKQEYEQLNDVLKEATEKHFKNYLFKHRNASFVSHKQFLMNVVNL